MLKVDIVQNADSWPKWQMINVTLMSRCDRGELREREGGNVKWCCESFAESAIIILLLIDRGAGTMWHNYSDITDQRGWDEIQGLGLQDSDGAVFIEFIIILTPVGITLYFMTLKCYMRGTFFWLSHPNRG